MSHITSIDLHIKDLDALKAACPKLGLEFVENKKKYKWYGTSVGGSIPEGWTKEELGTCDHVIRIKDNSAAYEVGVAARRDGKPGYQLLWDFWQGGYGLEKVIGKDAGLLKQRYAAEVSRKEALRNGFRVTERVMPNGNIVMEASR